MSEVICKTCRDKGWVLHMTVSGGNMSIGCDDCPPGRANQEACAREMQKALAEAEKNWNRPEVKNAWDRAMQELEAERAAQETKYDYEIVIDNLSGRIDLKLFKHGVWFYIEDARDCCSVGITPDEIDYLVERLLDLKQQFLKEKEQAQS